MATLEIRFFSSQGFVVIFVVFALCLVCDSPELILSSLNCILFVASQISAWLPYDFREFSLNILK